jgi:predicted nucleotidyltransferase
MSQDRVDAAHFSTDTQEFIRLLHSHRVQYVITGGEAVIYYGHVRLTGDVDIFYDRRPENAQRLFQALIEFWDGDIPGVSEAVELTEAGLILQFGRPPNRIDLLNRIEGVSFEEAWSERREVLLASESNTVPLYYIGLEQLITNKESAGRPKDRDDLRYLKQIAQEESE